MYVYYNNNYQNKLVGDCVIRALSAFLGQEWQTTYIELCVKGYELADMPSSNAVWNAYLQDKGYKRTIVNSDCPNCITVREFAKKYNKGRFFLFVGEHVICLIDGRYLDTWDSGDKVVEYYYSKRQTPD